MLTVILQVTSTPTDISQYTKLLKGEDILIIVHDESVGLGDFHYEGNVVCHAVGNSEKIVKLYNEIVEKTDKKSDILLLSDCIDLHGDIFDEMHSCLYAAEKHAIVNGQEIENKRSQIETAKKYLPKYSITKQTNINCVLIKRKVINNLGFLDSSYDTLKYALMDYYCKINRYGFSSVISHHALFSCIDNPQDFIIDFKADEDLFTSRYEHRADKEVEISMEESHPCVEFLTVLDEEYYPKKRILFDFIVMHAWHCGTSEYQLSSFEAFNRLFGEKYDIFIYVNRDADEYHKLSTKYGNVFYPDTIVGKFHMVFAANQLMFYEQQIAMNKHGLKVVQTMFDIMLVRIDEHIDVDVNGNAELGIRLSDGIVFISNYTKNDFLACFADKSSVENKLLKVIYPAAGIGIETKSNYELPFDNYFLVVGNAYKHKAIKEILDVISNTSHNYIVVGYGDDEYITPNIYSYKSGHLEDDFLSYLYANCRAVIFPSLYEGFGLPLVAGFKNNKRVIVNNNALNNELLEHFHNFEEYFLFFDRFEQIREIVDDTDFSSEVGNVQYTDTWDRVAVELELFFCDILESDVDVDKLEKRWYMYKLIAAKMRNAEELIASLRSEVLYLSFEIIPFLSKPFKMNKLLPLLSFAIKTYVSNRHQRLYGLLRRLAKKDAKSG